MVNGTSVEAVPFPNEDHQAGLADYKYSASRMSNAPSITATLNYPTCLDAEWSDRVYVEFRGEKYYIKDVPSSSHDNNSNLYKHNLEFTSERIMLDSVYFFDVVQENSENDKPVANSADFSFYGTVKEFAERLNRSMLWSGVGGDGGYKVVIDSGVEFKDAMYTASNQYISDALKSMYEIYELPYYFVGKEIHIGYAERVIEDPLKYGAKDSLISVGKNYTNDKIINRITGTGSDKNITYYYPNPTPKGFIELESNSTTAVISVADMRAFSNAMPLNKEYKFFGYTYNHGNIIDAYRYMGYRGNDVPSWILGNPEPFTADHVSNNSSYRTFMYVDYKFNVEFKGTYNFELIEPNIEILEAAPGLTGIETKYSVSILGGKREITNGTFAVTTSNNEIEFTIVVDIKCTGYPTTYSTIIINPLGVKSVEVDSKILVDTETMRIVPLESLGLSITSGTPKHGDVIAQREIKRVNVQNTLMPSIYRETDGEERFYIAENDKYKDEEGNDIVFKRPYSKDRPKEYILNNDEIFPTIEGMTNASGLRIDMFSEFAYDKDDNDEIYPEDYENSKLAGKYKHPYFFGKLRKFDGEHGFNLFDHAIEGGEMTFSFKTGKVGGCNFKIGVDEDEGKYNLVQVYEVDTYEDGFGWHRKGELKRDENGNVLSGYAPNGGSQTPQACQQDTVNNEVWIALKKDVDTFGVLMPNAENSYRPSTEDTFVIINIDLPEAYVTAAEKRLENEIIKYMGENNDYKFTFSAKLSRIFFAENEQFASELNENSKVAVEYDGVIYPMYVSSYSYNVKETEALPEVQIELNDEIKIFKSAKQKTSEAINYKIANIVNTTLKVNTTTNDKIDSIINFVTKVDNIEKQNSESLSIIASDRQLYLSEKVVVDNNYKSIEAEYDNFVSTYSDVVDAGNNELSDLNGITLLVRDTTNALSIFREATKVYEKQLNAVILSSGVVSPGQDIQIARDNYYASLANIKEKISNGTRENMDSIAKDINDIKYLNEVFGEDNNQYSNGAVLSRLLGVKNSDADNPNTVAGLYGGGVEALDDLGFKNTDGQTLMMFAGAEGIEGAKSAEFRVYEDGTTYMGKGVFSGVIKHRSVTITPLNISSILPEKEENSNYRKISIDQMFALMQFRNIGTAKFPSNYNIYCGLPTIYQGRLFDEYGACNGKLDELRGLIGARMLIYNFTEAVIYFCGKRYNPETGEFSAVDVCYPDWVIGKNAFGVTECRIDISNDGCETIYWDIRVGNIYPNN